MSGMPASVLATSSITAIGFEPASKASVDASWMVGPSMTGSLKGIPTSIASAPAAAKPSIRRGHSPTG